MIPLRQGSLKISVPLLKSLLVVIYKPQKKLNDCGRKVYVHVCPCMCVGGWRGRYINQPEK
jgi:hypothetical protein